MITFERVSKIYEENQTALKNISMQIDSGEFVFLTGESGCGKTTLLKLLLRQIMPEYGRIMVNGSYLDEIKKSSLPRYRRSIGMIYQDYKLIPDKTVYENVLLARQIAGAGRTEARGQVSAVLSMFGLTKRYKQYPDELSGGEKQRACLARAIINHPGIILADEPTGNLDRAGSEDIFGLLEEINKRGVTVLVVTHDMQQVQKRRHRVERLENGVLL